VIAAFGQHFANTDKVPVHFHRYLLEAQELRHSGDYGPRDAVTQALPAFMQDMLSSGGLVSWSHEWLDGQ
jgi:uncharacterized protein (UPF0332 family)